MIDLTDYDDKYESYITFLAYMCSGSSLHDPIQYKDSNLIKHQPNQVAYFTNSGYPLFVDLRESKGYTNLDERADRSDQSLKIRIRLKNAAAAHLIVNTYGIGIGQYKQQIMLDGTKVINHWTYSNPSGLRIR